MKIHGKDEDTWCGGGFLDPAQVNSSIKYSFTLYRGKKKKSLSMNVALSNCDRFIEWYGNSGHGDPLKGISSMKLKLRAALHTLANAEIDLLAAEREFMKGRKKCKPT